MNYSKKCCRSAHGLDVTDEIKKTGFLRNSREIKKVRSSELPGIMVVIYNDPPVIFYGEMVRSSGSKSPRRDRL